MTTKSNLEDDQQVDLEKFPFFLPELEKTEVEILLRRNPNAAKAFVDRCAKGEIDWEAFTPAERGIITNTIVEATISGTNELQAIKALREADWFRTPATPEEFVNDPKYLGEEMSTRIYAPWRKDLIFVLDPKNEIHEWVLSGGIGVGKCTCNSFILTDLGVLRIDEVYAKRNEINAVLAESGLKQVEEFHDEGETDTFKLFTSLGHEIEARPNHRLRVFNGTEILWKETEKIEIDDVVLLSYKNNVWGKNPYNISLEQAELWGAIIGDGCIKEATVELTFGPAEDEQKYQSHVITLGERLSLKMYAHKYQRADTKQIVHRVSFNGTKLIAEWKELGLSGRSWEKKVPIAIRMGTKEVVGAFLRGLFDTDGTVYERGNAIEFTTCSKDLAEQVQLLFLNFGIRSSRKFKSNKYRGAWTVRLIGRESKEIFAKEVGFRHPKKAERLKALLEREATTWRHNDNEVIPIDWQIVSQVRDAVRGKGLGLKENRDMFVCVKTKGKQAFTYKALDKIVEIYGEQYLPEILKKIYKERYTFDTVVTKETSRGHCYDLTVKDDPSYISNGFISHNTRIAIISQLYKLHVLTCLRNIQAYFTLDSATKISFGLFSLSIDKAEGAISDDFKTIINESPYFKNVFPIKKSRKIRKAMNNAASGNMRDMTDYEIILPQGLQILVGSKVSHALSYAVVSAILDEMNFRGKRTIKSGEDENSAENLYKQVRYRITSRFERLSYTPGLLCVISSRKTSSDFLEARIAALDGQLSNRTGSWVARQDRHAFISSYSQWDVKPDNFFDMNRKTFKVFIGSSARSSRILTEEDEKDFPEGSPNILEVPESTRRHFEHDVNAALRELAGISSSPTSLLFDDPTLLKNLWDRERYSPFLEDQIEIGLRTNRSISSYVLQNNFFFDAGFAVIPKYHPDMLRTIHVDLSKSGDSTGIAMGGVAYIKQNVGSNVLGNKIISSYSPEFFIDFAIAIKAPQGDQIDYEKIQQFFSFLRKMKFKIHLITFDQAFSTGPMQMLIKDNFTVDNLSVDRTDIPYVLFRDAVHKNNVKCPYNKILEMELLNLIHDYSGAKAKVDHPVRNFTGGAGSKDISDAVTGVIANSYSMLTDNKKHPNTANLDIASKIINSLYKQDDLNSYFASEHEETKLLNEHIDKLNPFSIKP